MRLLGLSAGLVATTLLLIAWQAPARAPRLGAEVRVAARGPGVLGLDPAGPLLDARGLMPAGRQASGRLAVRNQGARKVSVRAGYVVGAPGLASSLKLRLPRPLVIPPGARRVLRVAVSVRDGRMAGRSADVTVRLTARAVGEPR